MAPRVARIWPREGFAAAILFRRAGSISCRRPPGALMFPTRSIRELPAFSKKNRQRKPLKKSIHH